MYSMRDLTTEIEQVLEEMKGNSVWNPQWVTQAIINKHDDIDGSDKDFYTIIGRAQVYEQVRKRIGRYKLKPELKPDRQLVLRGFERLQERYVFEVDGESVAIRVQDMTSEQRRAKAAELRAMGAGCYQHADELDRYDGMMAA